VTQEEIYAVWAPEEAVWSPWVAPVLFAHLPPSSTEEVFAPGDVRWAPEGGDWALILDLPGAECITTGVSLLNHGYRPVPVINAVPGPVEITSLGLGNPPQFNSAIDMMPIVGALVSQTTVVQQATFHAEAPPAFLLDSRRGEAPAPGEGAFDNRWIVIPQDFPSANFLRKQGISKVLLVQRDRMEASADLAHVLLRWQQAGIDIWARRTDTPETIERITVKRPPLFKAAWYRVMAMLGLRRSSAGGFGSHVPETTGAG
jgi:hypothetical protein